MRLVKGVGTTTEKPPSQSATPRGPVEKRPKKFLSRKDYSESSDEGGLKFNFKKRRGWWGLVLRKDDSEISDEDGLKFTFKKRGK